MKMKTAFEARGVRPIRRSAALALAVLAFGASLAGRVEADDSGPKGIGDSLEVIRLDDQHGRTHAIDGSIQTVIFTRDMDAGDVVRKALSDSEIDGAVFTGANALYVSDISAMPGMVARLIAVPRMRKRPYPMLLDRDGEATRLFPSQAGAATILTLDSLQIVEVGYADSAAEILRVLGVDGTDKAGD